MNNLKDLNNTFLLIHSWFYYWKSWYAAQLYWYKTLWLRSG